MIRRLLFDCHKNFLPARRPANWSVLTLLSVFCGIALVSYAGEPANDSNSLTRYEYDSEKMGVPIRVVLYAETERQAEEAVNAIWNRFDELNAALSDYDPESEIIQVCRKAGESGERVQTSVDLRRVLIESRRYCELTNGAFDVTVSPIVKLWRRSRYFHEAPPASLLEPAKKKVGLNVWSLNDDGVAVEKDVRFDVGGIAKGYALDESLKAAQALGVRSILIDASGDLRLGDAPPGKKGWRVGIASLNDEPACYCEASNGSVCCSGDANRYLEIDGVRYSHIIDPRTCEPLTRRCVSAVMASNATTADALASALCVLGGEEFAAVAERARNADLGEGVAKEPIEYMTIRVQNDAEPPYTAENVEGYASPYFKEALDKTQWSGVVK